MSARALFVLLLLAAPAAAQDTPFKGTVTDADGKPAAGVDVGLTWSADAGKMTPFEGVRSGADGTFTLPVPAWMAEAAILAYNADRSAGGIVVFDPKAKDAKPAVKLGPLVKVSGSFNCTELGRKPKWTNAYVFAGKNARPLQCISTKAEFEMLLPPGEYKLNGYGQDVVGVNKPLKVPADKPTLDMGVIDLKATAVAKMVGKPPLPWSLKEARGLPKTVQIADLKGKWVVLDFWGTWCGPCVRDLADTIDFCELHAEHRDKFEIVALHDSSATDLADMDKKLVPIKKSLWGGRDLPFPIVLDDDNKTVKSYTIQSFPTTLLIDPEGNVVGEDRGLSLLESKLPKLPAAVVAKRALDKMVGYGFNGVTLEGVKNFATAQGRVKVTLDAAALKAKNIDPAANIPLKLSGSISLRSWLDLMLSADGLIVKQDAEGLLITVGERPADSKAQTECAKHLAEVLAKPLDFEFAAGTLDGLCQFLEAKTHENFVLDPAARRAGKLDPAKPVPAAKANKGEALGDSVKRVLDPLGLEAVVRCEVVVVRPKP